MLLLLSALTDGHLLRQADGSVLLLQAGRRLGVSAQRQQLHQPADRRLFARLLCSAAVLARGKAADQAMKQPALPSHHHNHNQCSL